MTKIYRLCLRDAFEPRARDAASFSVIAFPPPQLDKLILPLSPLEISPRNKNVPARVDWVVTHPINCQGAPRFIPTDTRSWPFLPRVVNSLSRTRVPGHCSRPLVL
jgi:hypothetical protein